MSVGASKAYKLAKKNDKAAMVYVSKMDSDHIDFSKLFEQLKEGFGGAVCPIVVPVLAELDLKKAAKAAGVKSVAMIHVADINKVTGYIRGGCSPVGMKKQFLTVYDESCLAQQTMLVSGGRIGTQIECAPADLIKVTRGRTAAITQEHEA